MDKAVFIEAALASKAATSSTSLVTLIPRAKVEADEGIVNHFWKVELEGFCNILVCNKHSLFTPKKFEFKTDVVDEPEFMKEGSESVVSSDSEASML